MKESKKRGRKPGVSKYKDTWMYKNVGYHEKARCSYVSKDWMQCKFVVAGNVGRYQSGGWTILPIEQLKAEATIDLTNLQSLGRDYNQVPGHLKRKWTKKSQDTGE